MKQEARCISHDCICCFIWTWCYGLGLQEAGTIAVVHHIMSYKQCNVLKSIEDLFLQIEVVCLHLRHNCERMRNKIGHEEKMLTARTFDLPRSDKWYSFGEKANSLSNSKQSWGWKGYFWVDQSSTQYANRRNIADTEASCKKSEPPLQEILGLNMSLLGNCQ